MIKKFVKKFELYSILTSVLMIILSLFLIFKPIESIETLVMLFSLILFINGIIAFCSYFTIDSDERVFSFDLLGGITFVIAGILVFIYRSNLTEIFPIMIGIYVIVSSLFKLQLSINLIGIKDSNWLLLTIMSILNMILGILLIIYPYESITTITTLYGVFLLISEVISLAEELIVLFKIKKFEKSLNI